MVFYIKEQVLVYQNQLSNLFCRVGWTKPVFVGSGSLTIIIQVREDRVLSENRLERNRQSDQKKQEVKGVKRVEKKVREI